jgi:hypothetical protein
MTKNDNATRPILTLGSFKKNDLENTKSDKASLLSLQKKQIINTEVLTPPTPATKEAPTPKIVDNKQAVAKSSAVTIDASKEVVKKPKPKHFIDNEEYQPILKYLQEHYPKAFPTGKNPVPQAIGIHVPILATPELPFDKTLLSKFFMRYTKSHPYRKLLILGNDRINLDGSVGSKILETEVPKLKSKLKPNNTKKQETQKTENQQ